MLSFPFFFSQHELNKLKKHQIFNNFLPVSWLGALDHEAITGAISGKVTLYDALNNH